MRSASDAAEDRESRRKADITAFRMLLGAELAAGVFGLRLFIIGTAIVSLLFGAVWMLGAGLAQVLERSGFAMLGGDMAISVVNRPLDRDLIAQLGDMPGVSAMSSVVEMRTSARVAGKGAGDKRTAVELKAVDEIYPLYGSVAIEGGEPLADALALRDGVPGAVIEATLLNRLPVAVGDMLAIGERDFEIRGLIEVEPDRLSSGRFLVGPRVLIAETALESTGLIVPGALADFRYRLRLAPGADPSAARDAVEALTPDRGWELESPEDAGDRVRRAVGRTATFLGIAGIVALVIGLAGASAAATAWVGRRARTIALYRLSGATPGMVIALHGAILGAAALAGLILGFLLAAALAAVLMELFTARLHLAWSLSALAGPAAEAMATLAIGIAGAAAAALSAAARTPPGQAMRSGEAALSPHRNHILLGGGAMALSLLLAAISLPIATLAGIAAAGLAAASGLLALGGWALAVAVKRRHPAGPVAFLSIQGLAQPGAAAMKSLAIGIGIAGVTAVLAAQGSLERALLTEIPGKAPDLVLIDVQPGQVEPLRERVAEDPALSGLQADPFMRASILSVKGVPAAEALVRPDKSWVIEGDRSFSWSAGATESELVAGEWWPEGYDGAPLVAPEEDVAQAFDLQPGDEITYSVLGRPFTSEVVGIRKEYHRTFRPEYLMLASAEPFRNAPHSWIMSLQGEPAAIDRMISDVSALAPNVTAIDVRQIVRQVREVIDGAVFATLAIAGVLLLIGALTLSAVLVADVDSRRREALAYTLIGVSRTEIAMARLGEALAIGVIAALVGGAAGLAGGAWLTEEALHVAWSPGWLPFVLPVLLGAIAALSAGTAGGLSALPRGRGQIVRHLAG